MCRVLSGPLLLPLQSCPVCAKEKFITGQNEREETTQDAIVTKSAAFASYEQEIRIRTAKAV
jgi:hypothetical protein